MTADDYRRMALALDGVVEAAHMGHPDFRVGGRIFATLQHGLRTAAVALSPEDQARFVAEAPGVFSPESGAWGRAGSTRIQLAAADEELVGEALTLAWRRRIALSAAQKPGRATPRAARPGRRPGKRRPRPPPAPGRPQRSAEAPGRYAGDMSATRTPPESRAPSREELEAAADVLDAVAQNRGLLAALPEGERKRFLRAVSKVHNPDARTLRRLAKATARQAKMARLKKDDRVLNDTGIRALRRRPVFTTPNVFPPEGFEPKDVHGDAGRA